MINNEMYDKNEPQIFTNTCTKYVKAITLILMIYNHIYPNTGLII